MEFWFTDSKGNRHQLPVNPTSIGYGDTSNFEDVVLADGSEKTIISGRNLRTYSISSFFPAMQDTYYTEMKGHPPHNYVKSFKSWMDSREILQFMVTGTNINHQVTLRKFEWEEVGGAVGDVNFSIELKEYRPVTIKKLWSAGSATEENATSLKEAEGSSKKVGTTGERPTATKAQPKTYTVAKGDCLSNIAKKVYNDTGKWKKIYEANKSAIGKDPNKIKPGQKLVIPA